jgi:hypothetical protein
LRPPVGLGVARRLVFGEVLRVGAVGVHRVDFIIAVPVARERYLLTRGPGVGLLLLAQEPIKVACIVLAGEEVLVVLDQRRASLSIVRNH